MECGGLPPLSPGRSLLRLELRDSAEAGSADPFFGSAACLLSARKTRGPSKQVRATRFRTPKREQAPALHRTIAPSLSSSSTNAGYTTLMYCHSSSLNKSSGTPTRSQPRQGRKMVAQGASPGDGALTPPTGSTASPAPLSRAGGRGDGGEGGYAYPRLTPWATFFRPLRGLTSSTNF